MRQKGTKNLTKEHRFELYACLQRGVHKKQIAEKLNCSLATVYREIAKGSFDGAYDPMYAEKRYKEAKKKCGKKEKLCIDVQLAQRISDLILKEHLSPGEIVKRLKSEDVKCPSKGTIYFAIYKGLIPNVTKDDLHKNTTTMFSHGLVMIPVWMRKELKMQDGDELIIRIQNESIIIK